MNSKTVSDLTQEVIVKELPQWETGKVKWFDLRRRFGFVYFDDETEAHDEAFISWLTLQESHISEMAMQPGTKVRFTWKPSKTGRGRPEITRLALVDRRR